MIDQLPQFPPYLILLPCRLLRMISNDTIDVIAIDGLRWRIKLASIVCPSMKSPAGLVVQNFVESVLDEAADELTMVIEFASEMRDQVLAPDPGDKLDTAGETVLEGEIIVGLSSDARRLTDIIVDAGYASKKDRGSS